MARGRIEMTITTHLHGTPASVMNAIVFSTSRDDRTLPTNPKRALWRRPDTQCATG